MNDLIDTMVLEAKLLIWESYQMICILCVCVKHQVITEPKNVVSAN